MVEERVRKADGVTIRFDSWTYIRKEQLMAIVLTASNKKQVRKAVCNVWTWQCISVYHVLAHRYQLAFMCAHYFILRPHLQLLYC